MFCPVGGGVLYQQLLWRTFLLLLFNNEIFFPPVSIISLIDGCLQWKRCIFGGFICICFIVDTEQLVVEFFFKGDNNNGCLLFDCRLGFSSNETICISILLSIGDKAAYMSSEQCCLRSPLYETLVWSSLSGCILKSISVLVRWNRCFSNVKGDRMFCFCFDASKF
jgi:hypothetical protein